MQATIEINEGRNGSYILTINTDSCGGRVLYHDTLKGFSSESEVREEAEKMAQTWGYEAA